MKTGCALSLIFLVAGYFAGSYLIQHTEIEDQYWVPYVYGIGVMLVCLNAWGILQVLQKSVPLENRLPTGKLETSLSWRAPSSPNELH